MNESARLGRGPDPSGRVGRVCRVWVKICGHLAPDTAAAAAAAGAQAVGLIFAPSRRQVTAETARAIGAALPPECERIGVFVNTPTGQVLATARAAELTGVQLHGAETPAEAAELRAAGLKVIKAVRVRDRSSLRQLEPFGPEHVHAILLDAFDPQQMGGTGAAFDWTLAQEAARQIRVPLILAGGLTPDNVTEALARVRPDGVDVSSGVERDGRKDPALIRRFCAAVHQWEETQA